MSIVRICERWDMSVPQEDEGDRWFLNWVTGSPKGSSVHLTAGWHAYQSLLEVYAPDDIRSAREYFGGIGAQSLMIQDLFRPDHHVVLDYSRQAVSHLRLQLPQSLVRQADSYDPSWTRRADLVGLDYGDLTVWKTRRGTPHGDLLERVFMLEPMAVVLTDIAWRYLHLHRERYETLLGEGTCGSYPSYLAAFTEFLRREYGYVLVAGFYHTWSTVMALVPQEATPYGSPGEFVPTPSSPVGLIRGR